VHGLERDNEGELVGIAGENEPEAIGRVLNEGA
jgi:hypothetical protein